MKKQLDVPLSEIQFSYSKSSGAGGQNLHKTHSKVTLHWPYLQSQALSPEAKIRFQEKFSNLINEEDLCVISSETHRSQLDNKKACLQKLNSLFQKALEVPKKRKKTTTPKSAIRKRLITKRLNSDKKRFRSEKF